MMKSPLFLHIVKILALQLFVAGALTSLGELAYALLWLWISTFAWLGFHLFYAYSLSQAALRFPKVPDGKSIWSPIFLELHRYFKKQTDKQKTLSNRLGYFVSAAQAMPEGLILLDQNESITWLNRTAQVHFLGLSPSDIGHQIRQLIRDPAFIEMMDQAQAVSIMLHPQSQPDRLLTIEKIAFGQQQTMIISRDMTEFARLQNVHRDFVANVSHELRTPLTVIGGFLETLHDMTGNENRDQATEQFLPMMLEQSQRMQSLIEDLLILSRLENDTASPQWEVIDMVKMLDTLKTEALSLSQNKHQIDCYLLTENRWLSGNPKELHSALGNLVSNAVRYTPDGGRITLSWSLEADGSGVFTVQDTGIGIADAHLPRLTERFYRVDRGRSRSSGGTGLGLAIVKHVLLRHQAELEITSIEHVGSTFQVIFPSVNLPNHLANP